MNGKSMKLAVIGSGSTYLPDLAEILIERRNEMNVSEWRLMDRDEYRLKTVGNYVQKMFEEADMPTKIIMTTDLKRAVTDVNFAVTTIRAGLSDVRIIDETVPFKYGLIGQETTAPGGLMMGFRDIPPLLDIAHAIEQNGEKGAWLINLANPSGMLSEALARHSHVNFAGLCNGPTVIRNAMLEIYSQEDPSDVFCEVIGLNHLIWVKVFVKGEDVTNEAFKRLLAWSAENIPPLRTEFVETDLQEFIGWIPMGPYLRFYYDYPASLEDLQKSFAYWPKMLENVKKKVGEHLLDNLNVDELPTRAHMVKAVEKIILKLYEEGDPRGYKLATNTRGGKGYGEAGLSLISAIWNNKNEIHSPDVVHMGTLQGLDPSVVATTTSLVNASGIHPIAFPALPGHMMSKILAAKEYEKLAVEAAVTGNYHTALEALVANPLINSYYKAQGALDELLVKEKEFLPNFKEAIGQLEKGVRPTN